MKTSSFTLDVIDSFRLRRVLVIGDLLLDVYLNGTSTRLCPEAPVPVVDVHEKKVLLGGAANTVCNLRSLGASVMFCSVIGNDADGDDAIRLLTEHGIDTHTIVRAENRRTITKSRVVAGSQVITRIDQGSEDVIDQKTTERLLGHIESTYNTFDAILISDYDKGIISPPLIDHLIRLQKQENKFIAIDSKRLSLFKDLQASYAKPNYEEALELLDLSRKSDRIAQITDVAAPLFQKTGAPLMTVTLDADGSVIVENGTARAHIPAHSIAKPYVAGAGDTYFSAFTLAYLYSRSAELSGAMATAAAAIAVQKDHTAACSQAELKSHFNIDTKHIDDLESLAHVCDSYHRAGKKVVFTNGCFDILHSGHVTYLHHAKQLGDVLIVGLNTDDSIKRIKGKERPINSLNDRMQVLAGLSSVDHIIPFGDEIDDTPIPLIRVARPHIFAKGGDYIKQQLPEAETVESCGGEIVFIDHVPDHSTTRIINRITATQNANKALSGLA
jgi:D-beta-D-heptose 7-phosphate kinase / D-beta-D-heptose 1-phosphate adenosyltransferase